MPKRTNLVVETGNGTEEYTVDDMYRRSTDLVQYHTVDGEWIDVDPANIKEIGDSTMR